MQQPHGNAKLWPASARFLLLPTICQSPRFSPRGCSCVPFVSATSRPWWRIAEIRTWARYQDWDAGYSLADAERFLSEQERVEYGQVGAWAQLAAISRADGSLIGDCASYVMTQPPATAEIGITLAPVRQGSGLASEALIGLVTALFDGHQMHRVIAHADDRNRLVQRLLARLGFRCEARLLEADLFKGEWTTLRVYAVLDREWRGFRRHARQGPSGTA